jgi:eukaryotic-like serine/threonine-protein kinase
MPPPEGAAAEAIEQQLARILDSQTFKSAERSKALLRFIVQEALADRTSRLKDYTLGVEVLGRGEQFDPRTDPIARVEASRLRSRLDLYYGTEGASDPIRILVPKGGYIPEFGTRGAAASEPEAHPPPESVVVHTSAPPGRIWLVAAAAIAAALATAALIVVWPGASTTSPGPEMRLELSTPPTTDPISLAISPDGRRIVFVASDNGMPSLWMRTLDTTQAPQRLEGTAHASQPFWAPDGREIGFFADAHVRRFVVDTGLVHDVAPAPVPAGGAWNVDGVILFPMVPDSPIFRVTLKGDAPRPVTALTAGQSGHRHPHFLPDGQRFLFYAAGEPGTRGVYVGHLDTSTVRKLLESDAPGMFVPPDHVLFVNEATLFAQRVDPRALTLRGQPVRLGDHIATEPGGSTVALAVSPGGPIVYRTGQAGGKRQFIWVDRSGRELSRIGTPVHYGPAYASMSPDQRRVAVQRATDGNTDIWIVDLERGTSVRFTHELEPDIAPVWSPIGDRIVYASLRDGVFQLFAKPLNGGPSVQLLSTPHAKQATHWSHDGHLVLFREVTVTPRFDANIGMLPMDGKTPASMVLNSAFEERDAQFSPDGRWLAYQSNESGRLEVYVQRVSGDGPRTRISTDGGAQARWRADGLEIFYLSLDGQLISVPLKPSDTTDELRAGTPTPLFAARVGPVQGVALHHYIPSPTGDRFLLDTLLEEPAPPLTILLNWRTPRKQ